MPHLQPRGWLVLLSAAILSLKLAAAFQLGFADAEALYVTYSMFPQPAYLDHPGLVGLAVRGLGSDPTPLRVHLATAVLNTALPWCAVLVARALGAKHRASYLSGFAMLLVPMLSIGLFAFTPDLLLCGLWIVALGCAGRWLGSAPASFKAVLWGLATGAAIGLACLSKVSGLLLWIAVLATFVFTPRGRAHLASLSPLLSVLLTGLLIAPLGVWEWKHGFPMLQHRLVATQTGAGVSLRNLGALLGGQLLYVTPPFLWAAFVVSRRLIRNDRRDAVDTLLLLATVIPGVVLGTLCLWSRVAEPHWIAPAYLALAFAAARSPDDVGPRLRRASVALGTSLFVAAWTWTNTGAFIALMGDRYRARYDLSNDLHVWRQALPAIVTARSAVGAQSKPPVLFGPHWIVCAQLQAQLGPSVKIACGTPHGDDFQRYFARVGVAGASDVLVISDSRFDAKAAPALPRYAPVKTWTVQAKRNDALIRTVRISWWRRRARAQAWTRKPAD